MKPSLLLTLFICAVVTLTVACLLPNRWLPAALPNDKFMHFAAFAGLTLLALPMANNNSQTILWMGGLMLTGWLIECLQQLVPDRAFCWRDMAANAAGIAAGTLCHLAYGTI